MTNANTRPYLLMIFLAMAVCNPLQAADNPVHVIPESQLQQWWQVPPGHPNASPQYPSTTAQGCVAVAFEIHSDGSVSNERVWRSAWTDADVGKQIDEDMLLGVHQWHFVPATTNARHDPVYTYRVFTHTAILLPSTSMADIAPMPTVPERRRAKQQAAELQAKCEMPDFAQQVQAMINAGAQAHPSGSSP